MEAFVLAAGAGKRLGPLTTDIPKPMIPILGKPALYYTLANLKKNGIHSACINLYHRPNVIKKFLKNNDIEIKLNFSHEKTLLGTAGAIKNKEYLFNDTFVVMSGDGLTDINLKNAVEFHKKRKSLATIILKKIALRLEYGFTVIDKNYEVKSFIEKPLWSDIFKNSVNTGIYIFEPEIFQFIPKNKFFDFSMDLFPLLMKKKKKIYGYIMNEYWTDIGNPFEYKRGIFDVLDGKVNVNVGVKNKRNKYISDNVKADKNVKIYGPCFIGNNVVIEKNVIIKPYSVVSDNVSISSNVSLEKSIIWENSKINKNVKITNTIVGYNTIIPDNITLFDSIIV
ncbi:MAG: NDP-sugar synthase [Endomicrobium sp.]|jgi:mannose-1-phosphate guanylyltransferase/phosphomannomutase|nr:NDP-sugar synthase [Endomicrobium sp.]